MASPAKNPTDLFNVIRFGAIESTNRYALNRVRSLCHGDVITAETQTAGRGRLDRFWASENRGNLYFTIVLRPGPKFPEQFKCLSQYLSVMIARILVRFNIPVQLKWPNDILIDGKKICGILAETSFTGTVFNGMVLGAGINLTMSDRELAAINQPATSLNNWTDASIDKNELLYRILECFFHEYPSFITAGFSMIKNEYLALSSFLNTPVQVCLPGNKVVNGIAVRIDDNGILTLRLPDHQEIQISTGDLICHTN